MRRGDIVDYTFPGLKDVEGQDRIVRARSALVTRPAVVLAVHDDGTADLRVFGEPWEECIVRGVATGQAPASDRSDKEERDVPVDREPPRQGDPPRGTFSERDPKATARDR